MAPRENGHLELVLAFLHFLCFTDITCKESVLETVNQRIRYSEMSGFLEEDKPDKLL